MMTSEDVASVFIVSKLLLIAEIILQTTYTRIPNRIGNRAIIIIFTYNILNISSLA